MRAQGLVLAVCVLAAGTAAHAQTAGGVSNIQESAGTTVYFNAFSDPVATFGEGSGTLVETPSTPGGSGVHYNSFVDVGDQLITFESENTGSGPYVRTDSYSSVSFDVTNNTNQNATFSSTITAAGMGFYLADIGDGACLYTSCAQVADNTYTFGNLFQSGDSPVRAEVGFNFTVSREGDSVPLYSLSGSMILNSDGVFESLDGNGDNDLGPRGRLNNFLQATGFDGETAVGYAWDATDFEFDIGSLQQQNLIYRTDVFSTSGSNCVEGTTICLIAYSGFGDPVGRGGGTSSAARFASLGDFGTFDAPPPARIAGLNFSPQTFETPTFNNGVVGFRATDAAVPEPATWLTMILGFGLLGTVLRRRRNLAVA